MTTYTQTISTAVTTSQTMGANEALLVTGTGSVTVAAGTSAISANGENTIIDILGGVVGTGDVSGVFCNGSTSINIGATGFVSGGVGLELSNGVVSDVVNYGTISGTFAGITSFHSLMLINKGIIEGGSLEEGYSIQCHDGTDTIINEGVIREGGVSLGAGNDTYFGRTGIAETPIVLGEGNDRAYGGAGSDYFAGDTGDDILDGGAGNDTVVVIESDTDVTCTVDLRISGPQDTGEGLDTLVSIENITVLFGNYQLIGNDFGNFLAGGQDKDTLNGGNGNDTLFGGPSEDVFLGGTGIDTVTFTVPYVSSLFFEATVGAVVNLANLAAQETGYGNESFSSIENLIGTGLADSFTGDSAANTFWGKLGDDMLDGGSGNDVLVQETADGNDRLVGGSGIDTVSFSGSAGAAISLAKTTAQSTAYGSDTYSGIENLSGGSGHDRFTGNSLANTLKGNAGNDTLDGGSGKDVLTGGSGQDTFAFKDHRPSISTYDKITDYSRTSDAIQLDNKYMPKLGAAGRLSSSKFVLGTAAKDANDHLIYDKARGYLYYDADGSGAGAKVLIAQFTNKASLAYSEFTII